MNGAHWEDITQTSQYQPALFWTIVVDSVLAWRFLGLPIEYPKILFYCRDSFNTCAELVIPFAQLEGGTLVQWGRKSFKSWPIRLAVRSAWSHGETSSSDRVWVLWVIVSHLQCDSDVMGSRGRLSIWESIQDLGIPIDSARQCSILKSKLAPVSLR